MTSSSSLMPIGTPPKGSEVSALAAVTRADSASRCEMALSSEEAIAASDSSRASRGEMVPERNASTRETASLSQGEGVIPRSVLTPLGPQHVVATQDAISL